MLRIQTEVLAEFRHKAEKNSGRKLRRIHAEGQIDGKNLGRMLELRLKDEKNLERKLRKIQTDS